MINEVQEEIVRNLECILTGQRLFLIHIHPFLFFHIDSAFLYLLPDVHQALKVQWLSGATERSFSQQANKKKSLHLYVFLFS